MEKHSSSGLYGEHVAGDLDRGLAPLVFLLSSVCLCLFRHYTTMEPDEGIVLQGAQRILRGQVPYRDFFSFLTPGSFYLHAFLFRAFGSSFVVPRTALAVVGGMCSLIGYLLARRVCSRFTALLAIALLTLSTLPYRFLALHNWDSTLLALLALYCAVRVTESGGSVWPMALGSLISLTALFEQSKGVGLAVGVALAFAALKMRGRDVLDRKQWAWLAAGVAWPFVLTFAYFASQHALAAMWVDWLWPLHHYSAANRVRYGYASWSENARQLLLESGPWPLRLFKLFVISPTFLVPALPLVTIMLFFYWSCSGSWKEGSPEKSAHYCVVTGVLAGLLLSIVAVRADIIHFMYMQPLYGLLLAWLFDGRDIPGRLFKAVQPVLSAFLVLSFLAFSIPLLMRAVSAPNKLETRLGVIRTPQPDTVLPFVQGHVTPGSTLLVYPYLPLYNYFTATFSPAPLDYFQPGMNTPEQAQTILDELEAGRVSTVLFEPQFPLKIPSSWPGTSEAAIARDPIADHIAGHYKVCRALNSPEQWTFLYMVRRELPCP